MIFLYIYIWNFEHIIIIFLKRKKKLISWEIHFFLQKKRQVLKFEANYNAKIMTRKYFFFDAKYFLAQLPKNMAQKLIFVFWPKKVF